VTTKTREPEPISAEAREAVEGLLFHADGRSIHQRMIAVLDELPAIGKDQRNEQQKFMYRGHDDVMNALNPLLAKHGIYFVPRVLERVPGERTTQRGTTMYEVNLLVEFTFYGAQGDSVTASAWGEGTDSGDKSTNKAMTMALKNVVAQAFALATQELSDADAGSPEETNRGGGGGRADRPREPQAFDPATMLLPKARRGVEAGAELSETQKRIAENLDWPAMLEAAATFVLGPREGRTPAQRTELMRRWSNTIAKLEELCQASDLYHPDLGLRAGPEGDALIAEAFRFGFGFELETPLPKIEGELPLSPKGEGGEGDEAGAAPTAQEEGAESAGEGDS
jgi:hypothetical protein